MESFIRTGQLKKKEHVSMSFELELGLHRSDSEREKKPALRAVDTRSHASRTRVPRASAHGRPHLARGWGTQKSESGGCCYGVVLP